MGLEGLLAMPGHDVGPVAASVTSGSSSSEISSKLSMKKLLPLLTVNCSVLRTGPSPSGLVKYMQYCT